MSERNLSNKRNEILEEVRDGIDTLQVAGTIPAATVSDINLSSLLLTTIASEVSGIASDLATVISGGAASTPSIISADVASILSAVLTTADPSTTVSNIMDLRDDLNFMRPELTTCKNHLSNIFTEVENLNATTPSEVMEIKQTLQAVISMNSGTFLDLDSSDADEMYKSVSFAGSSSGVYNGVVNTAQTATNISGSGHFHWMEIYNSGAVTVYLGDSNVTTTNGYPLGSGSTIMLRDVNSNSLYVIDAASTGQITILGTYTN